ncbi:MAG TPA: hypothetical protein VIT23_16145, partial [Terrimicrobiaceae bacterium]
DDPSFAALKELAKDNSDARQLATDVSSQYETLLRAEKRRALLARLSKEQTSLSEAKAAVEELKMLRPQEDPKSAAFIRTWDSGLATIKAASIQTEKISHALEGELMPLTAVDSPPQISAELEKQIAGLSGMLTGFLATHPPLQFVDALKKDTAICAVGTDFRKLRTIFEEKHYIDAKDVLDNLALHADLVGPETARVVSVLQRQAIEKIEKFTRLRDEAKLLADSGKKPEALTKFEAAFIVIPDSDIEHQISVLKREVTEVSPKGE